MKEIRFIHRNSNNWKEIEKQISNPVNKVTPDELSELYVRLTNDLSYARTFYPGSQTEVYLNDLSFRIHSLIYKNKKVDKKSVFSFWSTTLPLLLYNSRKKLLYSFIIFAISVLIGVVSTYNDESFPRLILGDQYVDMTIENIKNDTPMAVYGSSGELSMFFRITTNNIRVSFIVFIFGIFLSFGTGFTLFYNGVMLGSFQYFFYKYGVLGKSMGVIWLHGTIEIFAIVVAGAAGLVLGNSILFPGTLPRVVSMRRGAVKGLKIVIGLIPFFIIAGFIESFITRYENMNYIFKAIVIGGSIILLIYYFGFYPNKVATKIENK